MATMAAVTENDCGAQPRDVNNCGPSDGDREMLDRLLLRMHGTHGYDAMDELVSRLRVKYSSMLEDRWRHYVTEVLLPHPIRNFLHDDPFTYRAFSKPRGYAGDAVMIDMIYAAENREPLDDSSGRFVTRYTTDGSAPHGVRNRRRKLAALLDEVIDRRPDARVLALAAGHLREMDLARNAVEAFRGEIIAFDQDAESLTVVERDYSSRGVRTLHASVKHLLVGKIDLRGFDLVYAAGLFDYLSQPIAKALCERMFDMLSPGGRLLIANFVPDIPDVGYMESFMDWHLVYRDEVAMRDLAAGIPRQRMADLDISFDVTRNIVYLSLVARG